ncbi:hypothetical protein [Intestinibacter bartlettii]|uniref:Uncharacterized protein n=1 Tax=Intestinibacter bartlettii TaxID=261299 RepID=A0ABS6DXY3_9FIRM|nr:hypothetical protein [Intestinibacter bartlettii]MBU5336684.1 hypothetical protein [Intestinibacter bartlettii]MDO5010631.1 hypothetical protein [Intestinibacter bartlettii]
MWFIKRKKIKHPPEMSKKDMKIKIAAEKQLSKEIREHYISASNAVTRICKNATWTRKYYNKFLKKYGYDSKFLNNRGLDIMLEVYTLGNKVTDYTNLHDIIFDRTLVEKIAKRHFYSDDVKKIMLNYDNSLKQIMKITKGFEGNSPFERAEQCGFIALYNNFRNNDWDYIIGSLVFNKYKYNFNRFNKYWLDLDNNRFGRFFDESSDELSFFTMQYGYVFLFLSHIIMLRKYDVFIQNEIVSSVLEQIKNDNNNKIEVFQEFYLIYSSLYRSAYDAEFTYDEIGAFIIKGENIQKRKMFLECDYYSHEIKSFKEDKDFDKLINSIDKNVFLKEHSKKDPFIQENIRYFHNDLFDYLMIKVMDDLEDRQILEILFSKEIYINKLLERR